MGLSATVDVMATTQCPHCQLVLTIPPEGLGRRLKCPSCSGKFHAGTPESRPPSKAPGVAEARAASASWPSAGRPSAGDLPIAPGSLRETFDIPLADGPGFDRAGDAAALFRDDEVPVRRRTSRAEARMSARSCSACGGLVPSGMSLCQNCGLDQETGQRIELAEEVETLGLEVGPQGPPAGLQVVAITMIVACGGLGLIAGVFALSAGDDLGRLGGLLMLLVGAFGAFAAWNVLRGRSPRMLLAALALGAVVDVGALIVVPAIQAGEVPAVSTEKDLLATINVEPGEGDGPAPAGLAQDNLDHLGKEYDLDLRRVTMGLVVLVLEGVIFAYLMSPGVRRHYERN